MNIITRKFLHEMYCKQQRQYGFDAQSYDEFQSWSTKLRAKLRELMGIDCLETCEMDVVYEQKEQMNGYMRQKIYYRSFPNLYTPAYLLYPDGLSGKGRAMVALHGHGRGVEDVMGIAHSDDDAKGISATNYDYAVQLVQRGYVVIAPNLTGFGERRLKNNAVWDCRSLQPYAMLLGTNLWAIKFVEIQKAIDILEQSDYVDKERIGCLGLSGGGQMTTVTAALDERIRAAVISGYINTFLDSILAMEHCLCNYLPGILKYAESYDIASLIAPRPLYVESGTRDPIFPVDAAKYAVNKIRRAYQVLQAEDKLYHDVFEGDHRFYGHGCFHWLEKHL
jgi:dienelactone hydrolase